MIFQEGGSDLSKFHQYPNSKRNEINCIHHTIKFGYV